MGTTTKGDAMYRRHYTLDDNGDPVPEPDLLKWAEWLEGASSQRVVAQDNVGEVLVSTVFLGLNHSFTDGPPILYETMIFGGNHDSYQDRYRNKVAAAAGHDRAMALVRDSDHHNKES